REPHPRRRSLHHRGTVPRRAHVPLRLPCRPPPSPRHRGTRSAASWLSMSPPPTGGRPVPDAHARDTWIGEPPTREQIEERLGNDAEARSVLFDWSMAEFVEHYLRDERLQIAYLGQGVIGTNASPFDPGTASIRFHHASGRLGGMPGMWGYVRGGMGMVSFYFCDAALESGATVVSGVPVSQILPGEGVVLECGERIAARTIVSNAAWLRSRLAMTEVCLWQWVRLLSRQQSHMHRSLFIRRSVRGAVHVRPRKSVDRLQY